ncbi:uncharacterized protein LOC119310341 [Triticum dicoccoides]|uniref:uncharacterized protein LOC119310341 n=1 Tax=Triticum dicoccoides TaxID=85692 RepID=UPI001891C9AA|nr:uncharacterized protein LOC119310341 [Triticum dicoccoides]
MDPPTAAAAMRRWENLQEDLVGCIGDGVEDLKCYASVRGACTAWRRALKPPSPLLLIGQNSTATAFSLPTRRSFSVRAIPGPYFGSKDGWVAYLSDCWPWLWAGFCVFILSNPMTALDVFLPLLGCENRLVTKVVFAPSPAKDDFTAAAICGVTGLGYVVAWDKEWTILDPLRLHARYQLTDVLFYGKGTVYYLTWCGDVHVLHLAELRRIGPTLVTTVEPLLSANNHPFEFDPETSFKPFHGKLSSFTGAKHLVFCEGNLYQIWGNASCRVNLCLPSGSGRRWVEQNEIFVLRYYPQHQPCWDAVTGLGAYSVFVGRNNAVSIYAQGVSRLKGNCVYWISRFTSYVVGF